MRCTVFILFLSAGTLAFGQAGSLTPEQLSQAPSPWTSQSRDFGKMTPQQWNGLSSLHSSTVLSPPPKQAARFGNADLDPQMVRHPSAKDLGTQPPGTQVAQNLFPGLRFQPVDEQQNAPASGPLSTTWPRLHVGRIPTEWPELNMETVGGSSAVVNSLAK